MTAKLTATWWPGTGQVRLLRRAVGLSEDRGPHHCATRKSVSTAARYPNGKIKPNIVIVDGKEEATELFGDYDPETTVVRVWMRNGDKKNKLHRLVHS
jgi:hypothetical protein